jgi:sigma-B regulation protein RsbU (phosphoserine phosphatase)
MRRSRKSQPLFDRVGGFFRDYTEGMNSRDLQRLFQRDAANVYAVLTREHARDPEPERGFKRWLHRTRLAFLGLSYKLTPARRLLFAVAILFLILGFTQDIEIAFDNEKTRILLDFSPLWFMASVLSLIYLLALELVDRVRVRDELEVARELQAALLPHEMPVFPSWSVAHSYRMANEVGGDYYDLMPLPDGRVALIVGDASGHGMGAGLVMAIANATLKTALDLDPSPERVVALLNRTIWRIGTKRTFMSIFYAVLTPETGEMEYACAGHPFPLVRRADGRIEELGCGGLPLGIRETLPVNAATVQLHPGDLLVFYTDGLAEAVDAHGHAFSYERIAALLQEGGGPQTVHDHILATFDRHMVDEPLRDDLTLMVLARLPPLPPIPPLPETAPRTATALPAAPSS